MPEKIELTKFHKQFSMNILLRFLCSVLSIVGDYLLFSEDRKITCFNLKNSKPCSNYIEKHTTSLPQNGMPQILLNNLL